jgi:hypothetical protein
MVYVEHFCRCTPLSRDISSGQAKVPDLDLFEITQVLAALPALKTQSYPTASLFRQTTCHSAA